MDATCRSACRQGGRSAGRQVSGGRQVGNSAGRQVGNSAGRHAGRWASQMTGCKSAAYAILHRKRFGKKHLWVGVKHVGNSASRQVDKSAGRHVSRSASRQVGRWASRQAAYIRTPEATILCKLRQACAPEATIPRLGRPQHQYESWMETAWWILLGKFKRAFRAMHFRGLRATRPRQGDETARRAT